MQGRRCAKCGDVVGAYEPVVVVIDGEHAGRTSLAALGPVPDDQVVLMHESCFADEAD